MKIIKSQFVKYTIFGIIIGTLEILLFNVLYKILGLYYIIANTISFSLSVITLYFINKNYVYKPVFVSKKKAKKALIMFIITRIIGLGLDNLILALCLDYFKLASLISKTISSISTAVLNYFVGKRIFK